MPEQELLESVESEQEPLRYDPLNRSIFAPSCWNKIIEHFLEDPKKFPDPPFIEKTFHDHIRERDKLWCVYCKEKIGTDCDHVIPASFGGPTISANIVLSCHSCNCIKKSSFRLDFLTIAFNHLLFVGESLDWIEEFFSFKEEEDIKGIEIKEKYPFEEDQEKTHLSYLVYCKGCERTFLADHGSKRYCSTICQSRASYKRHLQRQAAKFELVNRPCIP